MSLKFFISTVFLFCTSCIPYHWHGSYPKDAYLAKDKKQYRDRLSGAMSWHKVSSNPQLSAEAMDLMQEAFEDIPWIIDSHIHLVGMQKKTTGSYVHPSLFELFLHPIRYLKTQVFISSLGVWDEKNSDRLIVKRLVDLIKHFPRVPYYGCLFSFSSTYEKKSGEENLEKTGLYVPNDYMFATSEKHKFFIPTGSLHPYQKDLEQKFKELAQKQIKLIKILPNSMGFSVADPDCKKFFSLLVRYKMILIAHVGDEHSVEGGGINNNFGNPLDYRKWLDMYPRLKIIMAHVGSEGTSMDPIAKKNVDNFDLVLRIMEKYPRQVWSDISAMSVAPERTQYLAKLLVQEDLHKKLLYGSDYPVSAIRPLVAISLRKMKGYGVLGDKPDKMSQLLLEIYEHNPLLANFITLRSISFKGKRFSPAIFYKNFLDLFVDQPLPLKVRHLLNGRGERL